MFRTVSRQIGVKHRRIQRKRANNKMNLCSTLMSHDDPK